MRLWFCSKCRATEIGRFPDVAEGEFRGGGVGDEEAVFTVGVHEVSGEGAGDGGGVHDLKIDRAAGGEGGAGPVELGACFEIVAGAEGCSYTLERVARRGIG